MYKRRCRRIVTTVNVELTNLSVNYGGVTTLITQVATVTHSMIVESLEGTAATTLPHRPIYNVLRGEFAIIMFNNII